MLNELYANLRAAEASVAAAREAIDRFMDTAVAGAEAARGEFQSYRSGITSPQHKAEVKDDFDAAYNRLHDM